MPQVQMPDFENVELQPPSLDAGTYEGNIVEKPDLDQTEDGKQFITVLVQATDGPDQMKPHPVTGSMKVEGRTVRTRVYLTKAAAWRVKQLLVCAGLLARDDAQSPMAKGNINTDMLLGTHVKFEVSKRMANGNEYSDVQWII